MKFKGREVSMIRRAVKTDPYYDAEYDQFIVEYVDGTGRETAKQGELEDFKLTDAQVKEEKAQELAAKEAKDKEAKEGRPQIMTQQEAIADNRRLAGPTEAEKAKAREDAKAKALADKAEKAKTVSQPVPNKPFR
jgi:hypothetical protein